MQVDEHDSRLRHSRNSRWVLAAVEDDHRLELHWGRLHDRPDAGRASLVDTLLLLTGCVPEDWFIAALDARFIGRGTGDRSWTTPTANVSRACCRDGCGI